MSGPTDPGLTVVDKPEYPTGLHLRVHFNADYVTGSIYEGEKYLVGAGLEAIKNYDSWEAARDKIVEDARERVAIIQKYGPPPETEVVELGDEG